MVWVRDIDSLWNFIGYVVLRAPDRFPVEDYLEPEEQMTLERAFVELRRGIDIIKKDSLPSETEIQLGLLLEQSLQAYRSGEELKGAHLLQDFQDRVFKQ